MGSESAGFLAGYSGLTREAYTLHLRQFVAWCAEHHVLLFGARRADIECFARALEAAVRARATVARRLGTVTGFDRYAVEEGLIDRSPAVHVLRYDRARVSLDRHATHIVAAFLAGAAR